MRRTITFILLAGMFVPAITLALQDTVWTRLLSLGPQTLVNAVQCRGTDVFIAGTVNGDNADGFVAKYAGNGALAWSVKTDLDSFEQLTALAVGPDLSPYASIVFAREPAVSVLAKFRTTGETLWTRPTADAYFTAVLADSQNQCYVLGTKGGWPPLDSIWFTRYNAAGTRNLSKTLRLGSGHMPGPLCRLSGGDFLAALTVMDNVQYAALVRFTPAGETVWTRRYYDTLAMGFSSLAAGASNTWYATVSGLAVSRLIRFSSNGGIIWSVRLPSGVQDAVVTADAAGNCYVVYSDTSRDYRLTKYDTNGVPLGTLRAGTRYLDMPRALTLDGNGYRIATGWSIDSLGNTSAYTVKFSLAQGDLEEDARIRIPDRGLHISPNPVKGGSVRLEVSAGQKGMDNFLVRVYDASGRCVFCRQVAAKPGAAELDLKMVPAGVYLLRVDSGSGSLRGRLVVQK